MLMPKAAHLYPAIPHVHPAPSTREAKANRIHRRKRYGWETGRRRSMTMHDFEKKHWIIAALIIVLAVGAFAYSWS
jgi:hypothetical protein